MGYNPIYDPTNPGAISKMITSGRQQITNLEYAIQNSAAGSGNDLNNSVVFSQYVVQDIIFDPKFFHDNDPERNTEAKYREKYNIVDTPNGVPFKALPRNSIVAKKITNFSLDDQSEIIFPFFPSHLSLPCKPGEHIWVFQLNSESQGFWMCKVQTFDFSDDVNHTHLPRDLNSEEIYSNKANQKNKKIHPSFRPGKTISSPDDENENITSAVNKVSNINEENFYEQLIEDSDGSRLMTYEAIPRFKKRPGDVAIEGSNNSLIVLGTDRVGSVANVRTVQGVNTIEKNTEEFSEKAGTIDLVVGRGNTDTTKANEVLSKRVNGTDFIKENEKTNLTQNEGDIDLVNDTTRVLLSQRTKTDQNSKIDEITKDFEIIDSEQGDGSVLLKTDKIRLLARKDVVILVGDASIVINSKGDIIFTPSSDGLIKLGGHDANLAMLCNTTVNLRDPTSTPPIIDSMGGSQGSGGAAGQFATKVLVK